MSWQRAHRKEHKKVCVILREYEINAPNSTEDSLDAILGALGKTGMPVRVMTAAETDDIMAGKGKKVFDQAPQGIYVPGSAEWHAADQKRRDEEDMKHQPSAADIARWTEIGTIATTWMKDHAVENAQKGHVCGIIHEAPNIDKQPHLSFVPKEYTDFTSVVIPDRNLLFPSHPDVTMWVFFHQCDLDTYEARVKALDFDAMPMARMLVSREKNTWTARLKSYRARLAGMPSVTNDASPSVPAAPTHGFTTTTNGNVSVSQRWSDSVEEFNRRPQLTASALTDLLSAMENAKQAHNTDE
jgi:hypothetical protein